MDKPKLLAGLHNDLMQRFVERVFGIEGFNVHLASSVEEMLENMGVPKSHPADYQGLNHFDAYLMDINLDSPNTEGCSPARKIYTYVKQRVESGNARFLAISSNLSAVDNAQKNGIPSAYTNSETLTDFLKNIQDFRLDKKYTF